MAIRGQNSAERLRTGEDTKEAKEKLSPANDVSEKQRAEMTKKLLDTSIAEAEFKNPGFRKNYEAKAKAEPDEDPASLIEEVAWEMNFKKLHKTLEQGKNMGPMLTKDLKRYYGSFNRARYKKTRGVSIIPDIEKVQKTQDQGVMTRIKQEVHMAAYGNFHKESAEEWMKAYEELKTPEDALAYVEELIERYVPQEKEFILKRAELQAKNPAAYAAFISIYNINTETKLFSSRQQIMDAAVEKVDEALARLAELTDDTSLLDPTSYKEVGDILKKEEELKAVAIPDIKVDQPTETTDSSAVVLASATEAALNDTNLQTNLLEQELLERKLKAVQLGKGKDASTQRRERAAELRRITSNVVRSQAEESDAHHEEVVENEALMTDAEARTDLFAISHKGIGTKEKDTLKNTAKATLETAGNEVDKQGSNLAHVLDEKGQEITDESRLKARMAQLEATKKSILRGHLQKEAKTAGLSSAEVVRLETRAEKEEKKKAKKMKDDALKRLAS